MVSISLAFLVAVFVAATQAKPRVTSCSSGQSLIGTGDTLKCCPGIGVTDGSKGMYCCVDAKNDCGKIVCPDSCKAKVYIDDSDYEKKVQAAHGSSGSSATTSSSGTPTSSASTSASAPASIDSSSTSNSGPGSTSTSETSGRVVPMIGMVAGPVAMPMAMYGL